MSHRVYPGNDLDLGVLVGTRQALRLPHDSRGTHLHVVGATGVGKSKFLENLIRQDIRNHHRTGCGMLVIDRHGSLRDGLIEWLATFDPEAELPVVPIDLRQDEWIAAYNPLRQRKAAPPVVANNVVDSIAHVWGADGTSDTPRFAHTARLIVRTLYKHRLTLAEAPLLLHPGASRLRDVLAGKASGLDVHKWEYLQERKPTERWTMFESTVNRFDPFVQNGLLHSMFGQTGPSLDLGRAMRKGYIILVTAATKGAKISEDDAKLFATLLLSDIWIAAKERGNAPAVFGEVRPSGEMIDLAALVFADETHAVEEKRVVHVREKDVTENFVSIKFKDEVAPWIDGRILKETMVKVTTETSSNLVLSASRIKEADVFRDSGPLRIYAVELKKAQEGIDPLGMHGGNTYKMSLGVYVVGGKPPYQAAIRMPGYQSSLTKDAVDKTTVLQNLGQVTDGKFQFEGFLDDCLVSVTDGNANTDTARFSTRGASTLLFGEIDQWYIRKPWFDMGPFFGAAMNIDWKNASSLDADDPQGSVKHLDQLDALKKLELASRKRTAGKDVYMYQFLAYPGLWSEGFDIAPRNQFTKWQVSRDVIVRVSGTEYPKPPVPLKQGDRFVFKPAGDAPVAVTIIMYNRVPTAREKVADLPLLPEPAPDAGK